MERLILLRHGKAEADAATGQDFDRALTERGRRDAALVAQALAEAGFIPDLALVSPAARAAQTWEAMAPAFPAARAEHASALYQIEPDDILALAGSEGEGARTVMVVGHNPGLGQLAARLALKSLMPADVRARLSAGFPTAAAAAVDLANGTLALFTPKMLGGGA